MPDSTILHGDTIDMLPGFPEGEIDAIVTDPPYGLNFMGKAWDHGVPGVPFWTRALRVAKPGAYLLAFGGTRTYHRLACAIEDAGWEIRDCIMWVYGSGFPKSLDVSKAIDKAAGAEREDLGQHPNWREGKRTNGQSMGAVPNEARVTVPATAAARAWSGWGTSLKPAYEPILVARKPLIGTVAANVLMHGTGAINIDGCRVEARGRPAIESKSETSINAYGNDLNGSRAVGTSNLGRWPANLIHDGSEEATAGFPQSKDGVAHEPDGKPMSRSIYGATNTLGRKCGFGGEGSAARFFYCAKISTAERNKGCSTLPYTSAGAMTGGRTEGSAGLQNPRAGAGRTSGGKNAHPTVKPLALMRYLCRLVTPPGGTVLDPFMGSGTTGIAALLEGFSFIGIEREEQWVQVAEARIRAWTGM